MNNPKHPKERNLIKGALRRVFSRSELRREALALSRIEHSDVERPRVTKWSKCTECEKPTPTYLIEIDHILPIVPLDKTLDDMTWDELVDALWCDIKNLRPVCKPCHKIKNKAEAAKRREFKKGRKANG